MLNIPIPTTLTILIISILWYFSGSAGMDNNYIVGSVYLVFSLICLLNYYQSIKNGEIITGKTTFSWLIDLSSGDKTKSRVYNKTQNVYGYRIVTNLFLISSIITAILGILTYFNIFYL
jgi:hypothetical protein